MGRVINLGNGVDLSQIEKDMLTEMTLSEFKKPVHQRRTPQELMSRTLRLYNKGLRSKLDQLFDYECDKRLKRKRKQQT